MEGTFDWPRHVVYIDEDDCQVFREQDRGGHNLIKFPSLSTGDPMGPTIMVSEKGQISFKTRAGI